MSPPVASSPALPIAHIALRFLIVVNWLMAAAIFALLVVMPNERWIMSAFNLPPSPDTERVVAGLRSIAVLGLAATPLNYAVLKAITLHRGNGTRRRPLRRGERATHADYRLGSCWRCSSSASQSERFPKPCRVRPIPFT